MNESTVESFRVKRPSGREGTVSDFLHFLIIRQTGVGPQANFQQIGMNDMEWLCNNSALTAGLNSLNRNLGNIYG